MIGQVALVGQAPRTAGPGSPRPRDRRTATPAGTARPPPGARRVGRPGRPPAARAAARRPGRRRRRRGGPAAGGRRRRTPQRTQRRRVQASHGCRRQGLLDGQPGQFVPERPTRPGVDQHAAPRRTRPPPPRAGRTPPPATPARPAVPAPRPPPAPAAPRRQSGRPGQHRVAHRGRQALLAGGEHLADVEGVAAGAAVHVRGVQRRAGHLDSRATPAALSGCNCIRRTPGAVARSPSTTVSGWPPTTSSSRKVATTSSGMPRSACRETAGSPASPRRPSARPPTAAGWLPRSAPRSAAGTAAAG